MSTTKALSTVKQALLEKVRQEIFPQLEQLVQNLPEQLNNFDQAETQLREGLLKVARNLLDLWGHVADLSVARPSCPHCGVPMRHRGLPETNVVTTVGEVGYRRPRWRCVACAEECYPHDASLRFLSHNVSWCLAKVCSRLAAQIPSFENAAANLSEDYRVSLAKETLREIAEAAGTALLDQEDAQRRRLIDRQEELPESNQQPENAYVFVDGTTVHSEGDWHEIRVMTVVTEDAAGKPLERHSRARFLGVEDVAWSLLVLARQVGYCNASKRAFIADGAAWFWRLQEAYFASATPILDWYHLAEHVHKAANALHGQGSEPATTWARQIKDDMWEGRIGQALQRLRQTLAKARAPSTREALHELQTYVENNQQHMDYARYRAEGLPVGSGQVEAQCKTLVGARCKQSGMRNWTYAGAESILRLRAATQDGTFAKLWNQKLRVAA